MSWYSRHPEWLSQETQELSHSSLYKEERQAIGKLLVSFGRIVIREQEIRSQRILIVYPEATPYRPPKVFILLYDLDSDLVRTLSNSSFDKVHLNLSGRIKFIHKRHQNADGSVCFVETGDLHSEHAEAYPIRGILQRIAGWLADKPQQDSREVELFCHFPRRTEELHFLLTDIFFDPDSVRGIFFAQRLPVLLEAAPKAYIGVMVAGETQGGVSLPPQLCVGILSRNYARPLSLLDSNDPEVSKELKDGKLISGSWWDISEEPQPFAESAALVKYIGVGDVGVGLDTFLRNQSIKMSLKNFDERIYVGLRFPGRRHEKDWQIFRLVKNPGTRFIPSIPWDDDTYRRMVLEYYVVEAVRHEYFTEKHFHERNLGRADRRILKEKKISLLGCGAIGSESADALCKAGIGKLLLVDRKFFRPHNAIRHILGLPMAGMPKAHGLALELALHNPFIEVEGNPVDLLDSAVDTYLPDGHVAFSSIADDNTEAYLNEQAVAKGRTVFYCRALRGGKAARIFRVIPHKDACKHCLALYHQEGNPLFPMIEEDPTLPEITNECNDPVRPASAADLKIISGIASRILLEWLEGGRQTENHWIWSTEQLPGTLQLGPNDHGAVRSLFLSPHPKCPVCQMLEAKEIFVNEAVYSFMKHESESSRTVETGGVLIGYVTPMGKYVVLKATGPGPKAKRTAAVFHRDVKYCQAEIDHAAAKQGLSGQYLGEWHYHPNNDNSPSGTDIKSLTEIARQDEYLIDNPIMLIFSATLECGITIHDRTGRCVKLPIRVFDGKPPV